MTDPTPTDDLSEDEIAKLLASLGDVGPTPPVVVARLDATLAELTAPSAPVVSLAARRNRRRTAFLGAAAACAALTLGGVVISQQQHGAASDASGGGGDPMVTSAHDSSQAESQLKAVAPSVDRSTMRQVALDVVAAPYSRRAALPAECPGVSVPKKAIVEPMVFEGQDATMLITGRAPRHAVIYACGSGSELVSFDFRVR
jgi:hypothetical protein